jgi:hypothetical protein
VNKTFEPRFKIFRANFTTELQNYYAQREAYTCSTYLNQEDETIEEDKMANIKLALDSIQLELDVLAKHLNMDQPLARTYASTPLHDTFPIYTAQELGGIMVADDLPLRVEEKEPGKSNTDMSHYMLSKETDGVFMPNLMTLMVANKRRATSWTMARSPAK